MKQDLKTLSKMLSYLLRHNPGSIGLTLDPQGWALIDDILQKSEHSVTRAQILEVVILSDKQRFALSDGATRIRANQGHSFAVDLGLTPKTPPDILYHGTSEASLPFIMQQGLLRQERQHVHLSSDQETARTVGARYGKPVVLIISSGEMFLDNYVFYQSQNGVWLTQHVMPKYLGQPLNLCL